MSSEKTEAALRRLRAADPAPEAEAEASLDPAERDALRERAIRLGQSTERPSALGAGSTGWMRRRFAVRAAAVLGGATAIAVAALVGLGSPGADERPAFAAEAIEIAEANPRLLVTEPGWSVTYVHSMSADRGTMDFTDGDPEVEINKLTVEWLPADEYEREYKRFTRERKPPSREISLLGRQATMILRANEYMTLLPPQGGTYVIVRGDRGVLGGRDRYLEVIRSLQRTDVESWLSALPAEVVRPGARDAALDEMLEGIPLPPTLDVEAMKEAGPPVAARYHLGAYVTQAVVCGWLDRLTDAHAGGDQASEQEAIDALVSSKDWPILKEMNSEGGWPISVWEEADYVASGNIPDSREVYDQQMNCIEFR